MAFSKYSMLLPLCLALLTATAGATQFKVGGSMGWTVPSDPNAMSYNQWAENNRFKIGDSLLFVYQHGSDSVLQVSQDDYNTCNTSSPIASHDDGNTVIMLDRSGPYYFISGIERNCLRNESMVVVVLADRTNRGSSSGPTSSPPPSSSSSASPPPPPSSPSDVTPSAPTLAAKNGASMKAMGIMGTLGVLLVSLIVS